MATSVRSILMLPFLLSSCQSAVVDTGAENELDAEESLGLLSSEGGDLSVTPSQIGDWPSELARSLPVSVGGMANLLRECSEKVIQLAGRQIYFFGGSASDSEVQLRAAEVSYSGLNDGARYWCTFNSSLGHYSAHQADISDIGPTSPPYISSEQDAIPTANSHAFRLTGYAIKVLDLGIMGTNQTWYAAYESGTN